MSELEFTGERYVPGKTPAKIEAEHLGRYEFASEFVEGRTVLDLGCGEGYGSHMLSRVAERVVGSDIDESAIEHARATYASPNLEFAISDATRLPFSDHEFSGCVCFEVVEHVQDPAAIVAEVARVLSPDGVFVVSTPNGAVKVSSVPNPFHVKEYTISEFASLLEPSFPPDRWDTEIRGQFLRGRRYSSTGVAFKNAYLAIKGALGVRVALAEAYRPSAEGQSKPTVEFDFHAKNAHLAEYLVAIITGRG